MVCKSVCLPISLQGVQIIALCIFEKTGLAFWVRISFLAKLDEQQKKLTKWQTQCKHKGAPTYVLRLAPRFLLACVQLPWGQTASNNVVADARHLNTTRVLLPGTNISRSRLCAYSILNTSDILSTQSSLINQVLEINLLAYPFSLNMFSVKRG